MATDRRDSAARRRVRWRERIFGLARPLLPDGDRRWKSGALILLYHRIVDASAIGDDPFAVTPEMFDAQVRWLAARFQLVTVAELLAESAPAGERPAAAITFDDGYACTRAQALPVLLRHRARATVFIDTARLNTGGETLSDRDVRALAQSGMEIGSHTVTHPNLLELDDAALEREVRDSRTRLIELSGQPVAGFAAPFGRYDARVTRAVQDTGYRYACTCRQHDTNHPQGDPYQLTRLEINASDHPARFSAKVHGRYASLYATWYRLNPATRAWVQR